MTALFHVAPAIRRETCIVPRVTGIEHPQNIAVKRSYRQNIADVTENSVVTFVFYFSFVTYSLNELRKTNEVNDSLSGWMRVCVTRRVRG